MKGLITKNLLNVALTFTISIALSAASIRIKCRNNDADSLQGEDKCELICPSGYKPKGTDCVPHCENGCPENAVCIKPDKCGCKKGFIHDKRLGNCKLQCKNLCPEHARCTANEGCVCEAGYKYVNNSCIPTCNPICSQYFECVDVDVCRCAKGFHFQADKCVPDCKNCTENQICSDQGTCLCKSGYKMISGMCEPICEPLCGLHKYCNKPGVCVCSQGYVLQLNGECKPICSIGCGENEICIGKNCCGCKEGYISNKTSAKCEPPCEPTCPKDGYNFQNHSCLPKNQSLQYEPICNPPCSKNQYCYKSDNCACKQGFNNLENGECVKNCRVKCGQNEYCNDVGHCDCMPGYTINSKNNICQPNCEPGYILKSGVCKPKCAPSCSVHATCVAPNICNCINGNVYDTSHRYPCHVYNNIQIQSEDCFKDFHIIITQIKLHCDTSVFIIYFIYACVIILPLAGIYIAIKGCRKIGPRCLKKAPMNHVNNVVITYQPITPGEHYKEVDSSSLGLPPPYYTTIERKSY